MSGMFLDVSTQDVAEVRPSIEGVSYTKEGLPVLGGSFIEASTPEAYADARRNLTTMGYGVEGLGADQLPDFVFSLSDQIRLCVEGAGEVDNQPRTVMGIKIINPTASLAGNVGQKFGALALPSSGIIRIKVAGNAGIDSRGNPVDGFELTLPYQSGDSRFLEHKPSLLVFDSEGDLARVAHVDDLSDDKLDLYKEALKGVVAGTLANTPESI